MLGQRILSHIVDNYLDGDAQQFDLDSELLELNIIDSSALFDLVELLRQEANVMVPLKDVTPANFATVRAMLNLVQRLQSQSEHQSQPADITG